MKKILFLALPILLIAACSKGTPTTIGAADFMDTVPYPTDKGKPVPLSKSATGLTGLLPYPVLSNKDLSLGYKEGMNYQFDEGNDGDSIDLIVQEKKFIISDGTTNEPTVKNLFTNTKPINVASDLIKNQSGNPRAPLYFVYVIGDGEIQYGDSPKSVLKNIQNGFMANYKADDKAKVFKKTCFQKYKNGAVTHSEPANCSLFY